MESLFAHHRPGQAGCRLLAETLPTTSATIPASLRRGALPPLAEISEPEVVRHYTLLSQQNLAVDTAFYPLGSCTMKHNPRVNEWAAALPGFADLHPHCPPPLAQGALRLMVELERMLAEITGMAACTLQPAAGAHGEFTAMAIVRAYFESRGEQRTTVLVPDSAHGTNPASARMAGFQVEEIPSTAGGTIDLAALAQRIGPDTAAMMVTNPNTLGLFEGEIDRVAALLHDHGALLYMDGANLNAILGKVRPGEIGFDLVHLNLHKTFSTPHGGGGPGSGPVAVRAALAPFLPTPRPVAGDDGVIAWAQPPHSIGRLLAAHGNFGVLVRAYSYLRALGAAGLTRVSEQAVLNANYLRVQIGDVLPLAYAAPFLHECVFTAKELKRTTGCTALDVAKGLIDQGIHPPTIYFPLIAKEALMVEPTETESRATLDAAAAAFRAVVRLAHDEPETLHTAPHTTTLAHLDDTLAARRPILVEPTATREPSPALSPPPRSLPSAGG